MIEIDSIRSLAVFALKCEKVVHCRFFLGPTPVRNDRVQKF